MSPFISPTPADCRAAIRVACVVVAVTLNLGAVAWVAETGRPMALRGDLRVSVVGPVDMNAVAARTGSGTDGATEAIGAIENAGKPHRARSTRRSSLATGDVSRLRLLHRSGSRTLWIDAAATPAPQTQPQPQPEPQPQLKPQGSALAVNASPDVPGVAGVVAPTAASADTYFYSYTEVDTPAVPVTDWELDAATLDASRTPRIVFDLFVRNDGSVVDCQVVEPADIDPTLRATLESRLRSTALLPAIRTGQPVDSVRRIELFVS